MLNEDEKESFAKNYYYHMECYCKVANVSKLEKAERNPKNEIQPTPESDMECEVGEPAAKYIRVSQRRRSQGEPDDLFLQGKVVGSSRCRRNILPSKCIICKKSTAWGRCKVSVEILKMFISRFYA